MQTLCWSLSLILQAALITRDCSEKHINSVKWRLITIGGEGENFLAASFMNGC